MKTVFVEGFGTTKPEAENQCVRTLTSEKITDASYPSFIQVSIHLRRCISNRSDKMEWRTILSKGDGTISSITPFASKAAPAIKYNFKLHFHVKIAMQTL